MKHSILTLTKEFITVESVEGNARAKERILELALTPLQGLTIERFEKDGVVSALVYMDRVRPKKFRLILNAHLDTIPGKAEQFVPKEADGRLYGTGALDMKASAACLIMAFKAVAHKVAYPIALQLTTDEETGGFDGTGYQVQSGVKADFVLAGEPTNFDIVHQAKGILQLKIMARGKTAHGAYPWRGDNAIWKMNTFLDSLNKKFAQATEEAWVTTVNVSRIETSNTAFNKIPDDCAVFLDVRFVPEDAGRIKADIEELVPEGCEMEEILNEAALLTDPGDATVLHLRNVTAEMTGRPVKLRGANGSSDARHFDCPGVELGPAGGDIGGDNEYVEIASLEEYYRVITSFLLGLS